MDINNQRIDWNSPDVLMQIVKNIEYPLNSIIKANKSRLKQLANKQAKTKSNVSEVIFSNSQEISNLIKEVIEVAKSKSVHISNNTQPAIFEIYTTTPNIQGLCEKNINPSRISKTDQLWLLNFEKEVFKQAKSNQLNLYDLSYNMAISERQLHRKIKNLVHLTPNKYIRVLKLHKAKALIDEFVYDTVSEIAYAVGYYDAYYFSKLYHQQYGITPKKALVSRKH